MWELPGFHPAAASSLSNPASCLRTAAKLRVWDILFDQNAFALQGWKDTEVWLHYFSCIYLSLFLGNDIKVFLKTLYWRPHFPPESSLGSQHFLSAQLPFHLQWSSMRAHCEWIALLGSMSVVETRFSMVMPLQELIAHFWSQAALQH